MAAQRGYTPEGVTCIEAEAFRGLHSLTTVHLPRSLESIGSEAFRGCGLEEMKLPEGLKQIGNRAFAECFSLRKLQIPDSVQQLGDRPLFLCNRSIQVSLPEHLRMYNTDLNMQLGIPDSRGLLIDGHTLVGTDRRARLADVPEGIRILLTDNLNTPFALNPPSWQRRICHAVHQGGQRI